MSHNSFDDAVLARFETESASKQDNSITINSLTAMDFKDYNISRRIDPISAKADDITIVDVLGGGGGKGGRGGLWNKPDTYIGIIDVKPPIELKPSLGGWSGVEPGVFSDRPSKYPLPLESTQLSGEVALHQLNERIVNQAVKKVQDSMTPAEKQQLNKDAEKYAEQMREYEEEMRRAMMQHWLRGPNDWPKMPAKPQSMVKYEEAIDREIDRQVKRLTA